jgi:hypothetical protein
MQVNPIQALKFNFQVQEISFRGLTRHIGDDDA